MKINRLIAPIALGLICLSTSQAAHADVITFFNFNDGDHVSDGGARTSTINIGDFTDGDDILPNGSTGSSITDPQAPATPGTAMTVFNADGTGVGNQGQFVSFQVNTAGYENLNLSFASIRFDGSGQSGFDNNKVQYSLDGSNFVDIAGYSPTPNTYAGYSYSLNSTTSNQTNLTIRYLFDGGTTSGLSGANGIDNIALTGSAVATPEPSTYAMMALGLCAVGLIGWKRRKIEDETVA